MPLKMQNSTQLCFPWMPADGLHEAGKRRTSVSLTSKKRRKRSARKNLTEDWPPPMGSTVYYKTPLGIQGGVLLQVRQGLVWPDYIFEDGRIVPESELVMCPAPTPWRDQTTVSEAEREAWAERIRVKLDSGIN